MKSVNSLRTSVFDSPVGPLTAIVSDDALVELAFGIRTAHAASGIAADAHPILARTGRQLSEYFAGSRRTFDLPLAMPDQLFARLAWAALLDIPFGETCSYAQQAAAIGRPDAVRAVGRANGANRIVIVIPCHRVIGSNGALTGFGGGLPAKRWLLDHEAAVAHSPRLLATV